MKALKAAIVDYGLGNLFSIKNAFAKVGMETFVTDDLKEISEADGLILPGMGAFGDAMDYLQKLDLIGPVKDFVASGKPFLGVCLGMQLLMTESEEFGAHKGLDIIKGSVKRFQFSGENSKTKIPQVGWNEIFKPKDCQKDLWEKSPLAGVPSPAFMYFVHSFYVVPTEPHVTLATTNYEGINYTSALKNENVFATQFHPERSAAAGLRIYAEWTKLISSR